MDNFNGQNNDNVNNNMFGNVQDNFSQAADNIQNQMNNFAQPMDNMQNQMNNFGQQMDNMQNQMNNFAQPMDNMQNQMNNFAQPMDNMQNQMNNFAQPMDNMQNQMNNFAQPMDNMQNQMNNFGQQMDNMQGQVNNFGQQMDNMQGQMAGFGQGVNGMQNPYPVNGPSGKPPKTKKPMSKGAKIGLISGLVALVAIIVCAVIFIPKLFKSPKDVVKDAMKNTFNEENSELAEFNKKLTEEGSSSTIKFSAGSGAAEYDLDGYDVAIDVNSDIAAKKANLKLYANYNNKELLGVDLFADPDNIYIGSSQLIDGYLRLPSINNIEELKDFFRELGVDEATLSQFDNIGSSTGSAEVSEDMINDMNKAIDKFSDAIKVEKKGKKSVDVNGKSVSTKEYEVIVSKEAMADLVKDCIDISLKQAATKEALEESGMDAESIKSLVSTIIPGDLKCKVYVAKNKVVKITSEAASNIFGTNLGYNFNLDIDDNDLGFVFEISAGGETVSITADMKDYKKNPNGSVKLSADGITAEVLVSSTLSGNTLDESFEVKVDGVSYFVMSINQVAGKSSAASVDGSKKTYDVVKMSSDDFQKMLEENQDKIAKWAEDVVENGGPLISSLLYSGMGDLLDNMPNDDMPDVDPVDDPKPDDKQTTTDEDVISAGNTKIKIKGCIDGYDKLSSTGETVTFVNDDGLSIAYVVYPKSEVTGSISDYVYGEVSSVTEGEEVIADETKQIKVDDKEVECRVITFKDDTFGDYKALFASIEVDDAVLTVLCYDFAGDKVTPEAFAQTLSNKYYEVVK